MRRGEATATTDPATYAEICQRFEAHLWQERERIYAEIHNYPPPIPACDAQFNYLIEKRAVVGQELSKVQAIGTLPNDSAQEAAALRQMITASEILNKAVKARLLEALA